MTIKEVKELLETITDINSDEFKQFDTDTRAGVIQAIKRRKKQLQAIIDEEQRLETMLLEERKLYNQGTTLIAGIDEVGRGPLAGPVVTAAVILPVNCKIVGLNDSKQVPKSKHEAIYNQIMEQAVSVHVGIVDNTTIDKINIYESTKVAMLQALNGLDVKPEHILIDAMELHTDIPQTKLIHGDARSATIAAASLVAKVTRDRMMQEYDKMYPGYGFDSNDGYGTKVHLDAINTLGITPIHRVSFDPIRTMIETGEL